MLSGSENLTGSSFSLASASTNASAIWPNKKTDYELGVDDLPISAIMMTFKFLGADWSWRNRNRI